MLPMVELNPGMAVQRDADDSLQVHLGETAADAVVGGGERGAVFLTSEPDTQIATVRLPVSGTLHYVFDDRLERWVNADDGHDLEGILVRDLLRQCRGFPAF